MGVKAVASESPHTAVLVSPQISQTSTTCRLRLRYFLWDSGEKLVAACGPTACAEISM